MTFKSLALAAVTATLLSGAALAQSSDTTTTQSTGTQGSPEPQTQVLMNDKAKMAPFYSDEAMTTLKTGDEFKSAFQAMSAEDQQRLRDECQNSTSPRDTFCEGLKTFQ
jgi:hypothetical protein